jgi:hypothetical protein
MYSGACSQRLMKIQRGSARMVGSEGVGFIRRDSSGRERGEF